VFEPSSSSGTFVTLVPSRTCNEAAALAQLSNGRGGFNDWFNISNGVWVVQELHDQTVMARTCCVFYPVLSFGPSVETDPAVACEPRVVRISEREEHFVYVEEYEHSSRFGTQR
jgi:hypothetical protein